MEIYRHIELLLNTLKTGSLITEIWGIKTLVGLSTARAEYKQHLFPLLMDYLEKCRPIDFATRTETLLPLIVTVEEKVLFLQIVSTKKSELSPAQQKKLNSVLKKLPSGC